MGSEMCIRDRINTPVLSGITISAEIKSLSANAMMYKFVVVLSRLFVQAEIRIKVFPTRDRTFKIISDATSTTIIERLRELKSFDIFQHPMPVRAAKRFTNEFQFRSETSMKLKS